MAIQIIPFEFSHVKAVKSLADEQIGLDYYSESDLIEIQKKSIRGGGNASFLISDQDQVYGFRLSYPAGNWVSGKGQRLSESLWTYSQEDTAYFQSLFIHEEFQKKGWGRKLSEESIKVLKSQGARGVVCHSWMESPGMSSKKYLKSMGFEAVASYPNYWKLVDYQCPRCGRPCLCTAEEMYLDLEKNQ